MKILTVLLMSWWREDNMVPSKWPIARIIAINPSQDGLVRAVTVKTSIGQYRQPQF